MTVSLSCSITLKTIQPFCLRVELILTKIIKQGIRKKKIPHTMIFHAGKEDTNLSHIFLILVNVHNKLDLPCSGHAVREQGVNTECDPMCYQGTDESHNTP